MSPFSLTEKIEEINDSIGFHIWNRGFAVRALVAVLIVSIASGVTFYFWPVSSRAATVKAYPVSDVLTTNWTSGTCASNLWGCVDEDRSSPNDADYIQTSDGVTNADYVFEVSDLTDAATVTAFNVYVRAQKTGGRSGTIGGYWYSTDGSDPSIPIMGGSVALDQGSYIVPLVGVSSLSLTQTQFNNLKIKVRANAGSSGPGGATAVRVSVIEIEVTYTPKTPWTTITQRQGVITNDQNNTVLSSHTAKIGERMRVITQVDTNTGDTFKNMVLKLQYDKNSSGTWEDVRSGGEIRPARSSIIGLDKNTGTGRAGTCTGGVTAGKGFIFEDTARTKAIPIDALACHDIGFVVDTNNATAGTTYRFRLYDMLGNAALNGYAGYASFTAVSSGNDTIRASKSNTTSLASTQQDLKTLLDNQGYSNLNTDDAAREILQNVSSDTTEDIALIGAASGIELGGSVANAGDVNGDGYEDIIIGAAGYNSRMGRAYIYYGGSSLDTTADVTMTGGATSDYFGVSVSPAGDVNGDGYADVVVGSHGYSSSTGRAYVYYGGPSMDSTADVTITGETTSNLFGWSSSSAGDVNGDGYDDVIVGARGYSSSTGRAYIYYGGAMMDSTADLTLTGTASSFFGISVSSIGDMNQDGYDDVLIGAAGYSLQTGRAYIYYGGSSMDTTADVTMTGGTSGEGFGYSTSSAGDVNGDGYLDIVIGSYQYSTETGRAYIYYGGSSMDTTADVTMTGEGTDNRFGYDVAPAGDLNGDGYADVIISANRHNSYTGKVYVFYGGSSMNSTADVTMTGEGVDNFFGNAVGAADVNGDGFNDIIVGAYGNTSSTGKAYIYYQSYQANNTADRTITGEATSNFYGTSVANAGDVNGDGYDDVVVGANSYSSSTGRAYIYYGGPTMDSTADVTMTGETVSNSFGISVASAGDVNGDGYDDVVVGAYNYSSSTGRAYVYYGGSSMDSTADVTMTGEAASNSFGHSVSGAGDVNGDGYGDVIVGAYGYSSATGRAYVYYGGASMDNTADETLTGSGATYYYGVSVSAAGDVNGDGYDDVVVGASGFDKYIGSQHPTIPGYAYVYEGGSNLNTTPIVTLSGEVAQNAFGIAVSGAGDVNGDGYDDVVVGAVRHNSNTGRAYILYGGASMDNTADVTMTGEATSNYFGHSVSSAGDVNGDGYGDVIVGAYQYGTNTGRAYVFDGGPGMDTMADVTMTGEAASNNFGTSVASAGDVNGDGYDDVVVGASGYDVGAGTNEGRAYKYLGGNGNAHPVFNLAQKHTTVCSDTTSIDASWNGQSSVASSTNNLLLQVFRFGSTNAWTTVDTESSLGADTDGTLSGSVTTNLSEYCDGSNWSYWRLYQASGTQNLQTDAFSLAFTGSGGGPTPTPTPSMDQRLHGGNWWLNGVRQLLHLD